MTTIPNELTSHVIKLGMLQTLAHCNTFPAPVKCETIHIKAINLHLNPNNEWELEIYVT